MTHTPQTNAPAVLMGWSPETINACRERDWPCVAVVPPGFEDQVPDGVSAVAWNFDQAISPVSAKNLAAKVGLHDGGFCVPLYEQTVEWAAAVDAELLDDPAEYRKARLFLNKAVMKHRAQMCGIKIGACEEALDLDDVQNFWTRVQQAALKGPSDEPEPIHLKPLEGGGAAGHQVIRRHSEIALLPPSVFPCIIETHLQGQEFSCEAFVSGGELVFLNITEYVRLGHSNIIPAGPGLEEQRALIHAEVERFIKAFEIDRGMFHPEYFIDMDGRLSFGEVAARVPGGHIFDLLAEAYDFDPYAAFVLSCDPETSAEDLREHMSEVRRPDDYVASLMVHPKDPQGRLGHLVIPMDIETHPKLLRHNLFDPILKQVPVDRGFGFQLGTLFLRGDDFEELRELLKKWEEVDFFPLEAGRPGEPRKIPAPKTENPPPFVQSA